MMDTLGTTAWSYDVADRLLTANQYGRTASYTWDAAGLLIGITDPEGVQQTCQYDSAHRLVSVTRLGETISYQYNAAGLHTGATFPNGITASYSYDEANRLTQIQYLQGPTPILTVACSYNAMGGWLRGHLHNSNKNPWRYWGSVNGYGVYATCASTAAEFLKKTFDPSIPTDRTQPNNLWNAMNPGTPIPAGQFAPWVPP
jgi:YD repeat-containing protein